MGPKLLNIKYEVIFNHIDFGTPNDEVSEYMLSNYYRRSLGMKPTRRGFLTALGALSLSAVPSPAFAAGIGGLIPVLITAVELANNSLELYEKIIGILGLGNNKNESSSGKVSQTVHNPLFVESSQMLVVEVPAGVDISIHFKGPAASSRKANEFVSQTALSRNVASIHVNGENE